MKYILSLEVSLFMVDLQCIVNAQLFHCAFCQGMNNSWASLPKPRTGWFMILIHSQNYEKYTNIGTVQGLERKKEDQASYSI